MPPNIKKKTFVGLIVYCLSRSPDISTPSQSGGSSFWNVSEAEGLPGGGRRARACAVGCFKDAQKKYINKGAVLSVCIQKVFPTCSFLERLTEHLGKDF